MRYRFRVATPPGVAFVTGVWPAPEDPEAFGGDAATITLGAPVKGGACAGEPLVRAPLALLNRHGLIAGATGTGKTKSLQLIAEQLSAAGVPVFLADVKGDVSGIAVAGESSERVQTRAKDVDKAIKRAQKTQKKPKTS